MSKHINLNNIARAPIETQLEYVKVLENSNRQEEAIEVLEKIIEKFPDDYRGWLMMYERYPEYTYLLDSVINCVPKEKEDELKVLLKEDRVFQKKENQKNEFCNFVSNYKNFDHFYFYLYGKLYAFEYDGEKLFLVCGDVFAKPLRFTNSSILPIIQGKGLDLYVHFMYEDTQAIVEYEILSTDLYGEFHHITLKPLKFTFANYIDIINGNAIQNGGYDYSLVNVRSYKKKCKKIRGW